jgi:hypothetical protein
MVAMPWSASRKDLDMRYTVAAAIATAVVLIAVSAAGAARTLVEVNAAAGWVQTNVWVQPGQTLSVTSVGRAFTTLPAASTQNTYFPPNPGSGRAGDSGPAGQPYLCSSYSAGTCAVENEPFGQLVGRVGSTVFSIGGASSFTVPADAQPGYLDLAVNDFVEWYFDNSGSYLVNLQ